MLSPKKIVLLTSLAKYKYLTRKQFARLGIEIYNSALSKHLNPLVDSGYINTNDASYYGFSNIYSLTKKGAHILSSLNHLENEQIHYSARKGNCTNQLLIHRTHSIDCQIELELACQKRNLNINFYQRDIDKISNSKLIQRRTRLTGPNYILEPDAIFSLSSSNGTKLFCLEYEHKDYTKRSFQKIVKHIHALNQKSVSKKYGLNQAHRVLFMYHNSSTLKSILKHTNQSISNIDNWILFKTFNQIAYHGSFKNSKILIRQEFDFFENWKNSKNQSLSMLD